MSLCNVAVKNLSLAKPQAAMEPFYGYHLLQFPQLNQMQLQLLSSVSCGGAGEEERSWKDVSVLCGSPGV